jgi:hypothetical protein
VVPLAVAVAAAAAAAVGGAVVAVAVGAVATPVVVRGGQRVFTARAERLGHTGRLL